MTVAGSADELLSSLLALAPAQLSASLRNPSIQVPLSSILASQITPITSFPPPLPSTDRTRALVHQLVAHLAGHKSTLSPALVSLYAAAYAPTNHSLVKDTVEAAFESDPFLLADAGAHAPPAMVAALEVRGKAAAASIATGSTEHKLATFGRRIQPHLALATCCDSLSEVHGRFDGGAVFDALARAYDEVLPALAPPTLAHLAPSQAPASTPDVLAYLNLRLNLLQTAFTLLDRAFIAALPQQNGPASRAALASELGRSLRPLLDAETKPGEVGLVNASLISDLERYFSLRRRLEEAGGAGVEVRDKLGKVGKVGVAKWEGVQLLREAAVKAGRKAGKGKEREVEQLNGNGLTNETIASLALPTSAILDIFPHLSKPYVHSLLLHPQFSSASNPSERVLEAFLEGNLPSGLEEDRGQLITSAPTTAAPTPAISRPASPPPAPIPPPASRRANVFDDQRLDGAKVRRGKGTATADSLLVDRAYLTEEVKAAIIARAERESSDEEGEEGEAFAEDFDDAGPRIRLGGRDGEEEEEGHGTHPTPSGTATPTASVDPLANPITPQLSHMLELLYLADPSVFERNSMARKGKERAKLRDQTGLADEQIEGWKIMLDRNPRKPQILAKHELVNSFRGNHAENATTPPPSNNHSQRGGRGDGGGGGGGGGGGRGGQQGARGARGGSEGSRGGRGGARGRGDGGRAQHDRRQRGADKKARAMGAI